MFLNCEIFTFRAPASAFGRCTLTLSISFLLSSCAPALISLDDPEPRRRSGQCKVITANEYEILSERLYLSRNFAIFSKITNDLQPKGPYQLMSLRFDSVDQSGRWGIISMNGVQVDTADTFLETGPGVYENLTRLMQFPSCSGRITNIQKRLFFKK